MQGRSDEGLEAPAEGSPPSWEGSLTFRGMLRCLRGNGGEPSCEGWKAFVFNGGEHSGERLEAFAGTVEGVQRKLGGHSGEGRGTLRVKAPGHSQERRRALAVRRQRFRKKALEDCGQRKRGKWSDLTDCREGFCHFPESVRPPFSS